MFGEIISGIGNIVGGLFGQSSQEKQMDAQIKAQRQFAKHGIRWRVEDATKAGVHPLYALGAQTTSFSPIGVGGNPLGEGIAAAGQDIGRAVSARGTASERSFNSAMQALQLERGKLENMVLASQLARQNSPTQMPVATPQAGANRWLVDGQGNSMPAPLPERFGGPLPSTLVKDVPLERTASDPANLHSEPGAITDIGFARTAGGGYAPVPSYDVKQRIEDQIVPELAWAFRNLLGPNISASFNRAPYKAPSGKQWVWSTMDQAYYLQDM